MNRMQAPKRIFGLSSAARIILPAALAKFALHLCSAPGYGFFGDELYTLALSRHPAFGYVDLPPLVPALAALSRALLGDTLFAYRIFPALAGAAALVLACLIAREFGGKTFAVALCALGFIAVPVWLSANSIFSYDGFDQLMLAAFLFTLIRFLRTGNRRLWIVLGLAAGIACLTKMTILFLGPGFLLALLLTRHRRDLLTPWPWLGAGLCLAAVSPYLLWQQANGWPTLEYWTAYGTARVYQADLPQFLSNLMVYTHPALLPVWLAGLYRIFRPLNGADHRFLAWWLAATFVLMFALHAPARLLAGLFLPLLAAGAVFVEELTSGVRLGRWIRTGAAAWMAAAAALAIPFTLPVLPLDRVQALTAPFRGLVPPVKEFNGLAFNLSPLLTGRIGWEELVRVTAGVYDELPPEDRAVAGIYTDWYMPAGAVDQLGPAYGLPHAVSGSLTYYLWGPGYSWEVMIVITDKTNRAAVFFDECGLKAAVAHEFDEPVARPYIFVCRKPKVPAGVLWPSMKLYR
jgi:hypothetical protein